MIILIDDIRDSQDVDLIIRNYQAAIDFLDMMDMTNGYISGLYLDHDLGHEKVSCNGYAIMTDMIENDMKPQFVKVVSSNPVGRDNIYRACENAGYVFNHTLQRYEL